MYIDARSRKTPLYKKLFTVILLAAVVLAVLAVVRVGNVPEVVITTEKPAIGQRALVTINAAESGRGLAGLNVELRQGDQQWALDQRSHEARPFWAFWGPRTTADEIQLEVGAALQPGLAEGIATLSVEAQRASTWFRRPQPAVTTLDLEVRLTPPTLQVNWAPTVAQGGSGVVLYRVGESATVDGVQIGDRFLPGYARPGGEPGERFAFFGAPHDLTEETAAGALQLIAEDELGNRRSMRFLRQFVARQLPSDDIRVSDGFLNEVVPEILDHTKTIKAQDSLLASYLLINRDLRRANAATLAEIATRSQPERLWLGAFQQLPASRVMATYGDRRTYFHNDQEVDVQHHLGYDLASVRQAPVPAANNGIVLLAEYFGIYGNTVVLDHGYGLLSLYSHLSDLSVAAGDNVETGTVLGHTGATGLAGGDHLHFSMLIHGVMVDPIEWWDSRWIRSRVLEPMGPNFAEN